MAPPRKLKAIISGIERYAEGVTRFFLKPEGSCRYRSGQFLHLAIEDYDPSQNWPESRVFSIARSPHRSEILEILVSPKGDFTHRMVGSLRVGQQVWIKLPYGDFNYRDSADADVVLVAGGTGISPFVPFIEELLDKEIQCRSVQLYYGVRKKELVVYDELLVKAMDQIEGFTMNLFVEEYTGESSLRSELGRLPCSEIISRTKMLKDPICYLSGPEEMIQSFISEGRTFGLLSDRIRYDRWE